MLSEAGQRFEPGPGVGGAAAARRHLSEGAAALGIALSEAQLDAFDRYAALLQQGRRELSLTTLTEPVDIALKHFLDSLAVLPALPARPLRLIDIGTGAGFPGVPLKLARPDLQVTVVEATRKKAAWVERTVRVLALREVQVIAARSEHVARDAARRGRYDVAVARAVAPLPALCGLCLPFVRARWLFVALKSAAGADVEAPAAERALSVLGGRLREVQPVALPLLPNRVLVVVEQVTPAPARYPRRAGMPAKRPLVRR